FVAVVAAFVGLVGDGGCGVDGASGEDGPGMVGDPGLGVGIAGVEERPGITLPANPDRTSRRTAAPPTHTIDSAVAPPASSNAINRCPVHQILVTTGPQHARPPQGPSPTDAAKSRRPIVGAAVRRGGLACVITLVRLGSSVVGGGGPDAAARSRPDRAGGPPGSRPRRTG